MKNKRPDTAGTVIIIMMLIASPLFTGVLSATNGISIKTLNVMDEHIRISYTIDENIFDQVESITVRFFENFPEFDDEITIPGADLEGDIDWPVQQDELTGVVSFWLVANLAVGVESSDIHSIIFLEEVNSSVLDCEIAVSMSWINYTIHSSLNAPPVPLPFDEVQALAYDYADGSCQTDVDPYILGALPQPLWDSDETFVMHEEMEPGNTYCFQIRSTGNDVTATSNSILFTLEDFETPGKPEIMYVDVIDNRQVRVVASVDDQAEFLYRLYRSGDPDTDTGDYNLIRELVHGEETLVFVDDDVPGFQENPWYYYVTANVQNCIGHYEEETAVQSSMFLRADIDPGFDPAHDSTLPVRLSWSHEVPDNGPHFENYRLIRVIGDDAEEVQGFSFDSFFHLDEADINDIDGVFYYRMEAEHPATGDTVRSNRAMVNFALLEEHDIPRAFRPDSNIPENRYFSLPFMVPPDPGYYQLKVFDRNGLLVYRETEWRSGEGWNGDTQGGYAAPGGPYVFEANYYDPASGEVVTLQGVIHLVR